MTIFLSRSDWDDMCEAIRKNKSVPIVTLYGPEELGEDEEEEYVRIKIEREE